MSVLSEKYFRDEKAAYEFIESHVWPQGPICPHCHEGHHVKKLNGSSTRIGTYKCYHCLKPFTVKIGTVFEASRLPLHVWLQSIYFIAQSERIMPAKDLQRALGVSAKTAKVLAYRLHRAMYSPVARMKADAVGRRRVSAGRTERNGEVERSLPHSGSLRRSVAMKDIFLAFQPA